nr:hypothetical protein HK105_001734 [Polyrhizophydium stewartii]
MLTILTTYVGMALVLLIPSAGARRASAASKRRSSAAAASLLPTTKAASLSALGGAEAAAAAASSSSSSSSSALHGSDASPNHALLIALSIPDVLGSILLNIGLFYVGSGSYQVIYSSVIIFTAIFSLIFMRRRMSRAQWLSIIVITLGLSISAWGPGGSDFGAPGPGVSPHLLAVNASGLASSPPTPPKPAIPPYPFPTGAAKIGSKNFAWGLGNKGSGSAAGEIEINEVAAAAALSDGNNLLANTDGSTVLQAGSPGAAAQDRLFAADPSQPPAVPRAHSDGLALGFAITLAGTALYASVYCLNDYYLTEAAVRLSPRAQCGWVGVYASVMVMLLQYFFSAKSLATMPLTSPSVITGYVVLTLASLLHNLSYFELLASTGAVATGVIQALRAVLVFALSHVWFCGRDPAQCLNMAKVVAAAVVVAGVLWFSIEKARVEEREREARGAAKP